jgi:hypothetical protein
VVIDVAPERAAGKRQTSGLPGALTGGSGTQWRGTGGDRPGSLATGSDTTTAFATGTSTLDRELAWLRKRFSGRSLPPGS